MKIDVIANDGSPLGVTEKSMRGDDGRFGVGGAELALLTMCGAWKQAGHDITLYNDPREKDASSFDQCTLEEFNPQADRDVLIIFRSPNGRSYDAKGLKVWWSTDQYTIGNFSEFAPTVNKVVTISPFHSNYFKEMYGITDSVSIDLPVRTWEYNQIIEKVKHQCIYTSVPDRGLTVLNLIWSRVIEQVPDATLVITSDWRLWSEQASEDMVMPYRLSFARFPSVRYVGAVRRSTLVEEQLRSEVFLHPCIYDELFCIACAEAQVAGAFPVTSNYGALNTTNMGLMIAGNPVEGLWQDVFVQKVVELLNSDKLKSNQDEIQRLAKKRFSIERILKLWDEQVFNA